MENNNNESAPIVPQAHPEITPSTNVEVSPQVPAQPVPVTAPAVPAPMLATETTALPGNKKSPLKTFSIVIVILLILGSAAFIFLKNKTQVAVQAPGNKQASSTVDPSWTMHTDSKEGISIKLPNNFVKSPIPAVWKGVIFYARTERGSQKSGVGIMIFKGISPYSETEILKAPADTLLSFPEQYENEKDYTVSQGGKTLRILEGKSAKNGTLTKMVQVHYVSNKTLYIVSSLALYADWEENKDAVMEALLSFTVE